MIRKLILKLIGRFTGRYDRRIHTIDNVDQE